MDGEMTKAPLGGEKVSKNPTDRGALGTKRRGLTEGQGIPLGIAVDGANRHEMKLVEATLEAILIKRPEPTATWPQHLCLDKGYDYDAVRETFEAWGYTAHIRRRGEEVQAKREISGYRARRWVVDWCCGSAGTYNLMQPEMSRRLLDRKLQHIAAVDPDVIATGNPGCLLQLEWGVKRAGLRAAVLHPIELLDRAYRLGAAS